VVPKAHRVRLAGGMWTGLGHARVAGNRAFERHVLAATSAWRADPEMKAEGLPLSAEDSGRFLWRGGEAGE
jgi:hypothetical protein